MTIEEHIEEMHEKIAERMASGDYVAQGQGSKSPPSGIAYSRNFAAFLRNGPFANQTRD